MLLICYQQSLLNMAWAKVGAEGVWQGLQAKVGAGAKAGAKAKAGATAKAMH